jgi:hypothetical protein
LGGLDPAPLTARFALVAEGVEEAAARPLSARKARLAAALIDDFCDRAFDELRGAGPAWTLGAPDVLAFRDALRARSAALAAIFDLCEEAPGAPRLVTRSVKVPIAEYHRLSTPDYMVSLYNQNTVQRVMLVHADHRETEIHPVLAAAIAWWRESGLLGSGSPPA